MNSIVRTINTSLESILFRLKLKLSSFSGVQKHSPNWFFSDAGQSINSARLRHLDTLGLPISGKSVLEVGGGIGLLSSFFEKKDCRIVTTDGRQENVDVMKKLYPHRDIRKFDLLDFNSYKLLDNYDIIFCYGTLYHTPDPEGVLKHLSHLCNEMILLETCVTPGNHSAEHLIRESETMDQAIGLIGCRPTRPWIMSALKRFYGYAYVSKTQPNHIDFDTDWVIPSKKLNHRAVFLGSKIPLSNASLSDRLIDHQETY